MSLVRDYRAEVDYWSVKLLSTFTIKKGSLSVCGFLDHQNFIKFLVQEFFKYEVWNRLVAIFTFFFYGRLWS